MRGAYLHYLAGVLVAVLGLMAWPTSGLAAYGDYISATSAGSLNQPAKVAVDESNGSVYVTDAGNKAVKRYTTSDGDNYTYDTGFSLSVAGTPVGLAFDERVPLEDMFYVGDDTNDCVWIYNSTGSLADLSATGATHKLGSGATAIKMPNTVRVVKSLAGATVHILVVDGDSDKVYIFNADGSMNSSFGVSGTSNLQFYYPTGIALAGYSEAAGVGTQVLYVGDQGNNRVQKVSYSFNTSTGAITSAPAWQASIGSAGDDFGKFLRVSDVAWDKYQSRLIVADSLQMVCQIFTSAGVPMTPNTALNYSGGAVQGYLNVPTGVAFSPSSLRGIVASNQTESIAVFDLAACGVVPSITVDTPASATPLSLCADNPYPVNFTTSDSDSPSVTVTLYTDADTSWNGGIGTGEATIGSVTGGPGAGSINWAVIGLAPGTYYVRGVVVDEAGCSDAAYSTGTITVGDADSDGLNDIFEDCYCTSNNCDPNADPDNDGLINLDEQTYGTDPTNPDTDAGGVRDGVEVAKGTDPLNGADDYSSAVDLVGPFYNINIGQGWKTGYAIKNTSDTDTAVVDVSFYSSTGGSPSETNSFNIPPRGFVVVDPRDYPVVLAAGNAGNVECRIAGARCVGYSTQQRWSTSNPTRAFFTVSCDEATTANVDDTLYGCFYNINPTKWVTWYLVKNTSDSPVDIHVDLRRTTGAMLPDPNFYETTISAHGNATFSPVNINPTVNSGNIKVTAVGGGSILGYQLQYAKNTVDPLVTYDFGYSELMGTNATMMSGEILLPKFSIANNQFATWILAQNPDATSAEMDVSYYGEDGTLLNPTPEHVSVSPFGTASFSPANNTEVQLSGETVGSVEINVTTGRIFGYGYQQGYNTYDPVNVKDYSITSLLVPRASAVTKVYGSYLTTGVDGWETDVCVKNPNATPVTANIYFYDTAGTQRATDTLVLPGHGSTTVNTASYSFGGATELSVEVVATGDVTGYTASVRHDTANPNTDLSDKYEGAFGVNLCP